MNQQETKPTAIKSIAKRTKELPSLEYIKECLIYDSVSGDLTWKKRPLEHFSSLKRRDHWNDRFSGKLAGHIVPLGYRRIKFSGVHVLAHRIIWLLEKGDWPPDHLVVDHIDRNPRNNKIENLRLASCSQNIYNSKLNKRSKSGFKNVKFNKRDGKWWATISANRHQRLLGRFSSKEEAVEVAKAAMRSEYGEFCVEECRE